MITTEPEYWRGRYLRIAQDAVGRWAKSDPEVVDALRNTLGKYYTDDVASDIHRLETSRTTVPELLELCLDGADDSYRDVWVRYVDMISEIARPESGETA